MFYYYLKIFSSLVCKNKFTPFLWLLLKQNYYVISEWTLIFSFYFFDFCSNFTVILDIALSWSAIHGMSEDVKLKYILKAVAATLWVILMPLAYEYSHTTHLLFILAILIYLFPSMVSEMLFVVPSIRCYLETSDFKILKCITWWSQVFGVYRIYIKLNCQLINNYKQGDWSWFMVTQTRLYIGRSMHESAWSFSK